MKLTVNAGSFSYRGGKTLLRDVSFAAEEGETLAILGPNGVGKTSLVRCMLGFQRWDSGETLLDGRPLKELSGRRLWQRISYVPQARSGAFAYEVGEMVLLGRSPYLGDFSTPGKRDRELAEEAMELAGVTHLRGKSTGTLSGGELQLVLIARALAAQPECLVLDEPETGLDFRNQLVVLELIHRLSREKHLTVILNTHYPDHALRIADRSLLLFGEGIYQFGKTEMILNEENLRALFGVEIALWRRMADEKEYAAVIPLELIEKEAGKRWLKP